MSKQNRKSATTTLPDRVVAPPVEKTDTIQKRSPHGGMSLEETIRVRAYQKWEWAGRPEGDGVAYWLEAESELCVGR